MDSFKSHKALQSLVNILGIAGARDKYARVIQYFCKFLANYLKDSVQQDPKVKDNISALILQSQRTAKSLSSFRKILRFGNPISRQQGLNKRLQNLSSQKLQGIDKQLEIVNIIKDIGGILYVLTDHFLFFYNTGIVIKKDKQRQEKLQYYNDWFWMWECVLGIVGNFLQLSIIKVEGQQSKNKQQINDLIIDSTRLAIDVPVIINGLNGNLVSNQMAGLLGVVSSLIGLYQLVDKDLQKQREIKNL